jgi:polysaccharide pyruvyl transferase WcaK-like protein
MTESARVAENDALNEIASHATKRKIVLFGTFGTGNLGNECTLRAIFHNLRKYLPTAEVECICSGPEETASTYNIPTFPIRSAISIRKALGAPAPPDNLAMRVLRNVVKLPLEAYRWLRAYRMLKGADILMLVGLGMLGDFGIRPFGLHYDILGWSIIAKLRGTKLAFVSVGVGPIRDPLSRIFVKVSLRLGDYRSYRDAFSKNYLEGLGFKTGKDKVYPDLVFSLPQTMLPATRGRRGQSTVIGVGLLNYYSRQGRSNQGDGIYRIYLKNIADLMVRLLDDGYTVRVLIGDFVYDQSVRADLKELIESRGYGYATSRIIDQPAGSVDELMAQLAMTDLVVASRFHNLLLGLMMSKPVIALSYHEKIDMLVAGAGLSRFCQDVEHIDVDRLFAQVKELESATEEWIQQSDIQQRTVDYRKALDEQYERIFS